MGHASPFQTSTFQELSNDIKKRLNQMHFDLCNRSLKIWESIGTPTFKVGVPLGV
jgi:hypothetical protein